MRQILQTTKGVIEHYYPWLLLLLGLDCFCSILLWIANIQAFKSLVLLIILASIVFFAIIVYILNKRDKSRRELFKNFLSDPNIINKNALLNSVSRDEHESIEALANILEQYENQCRNMSGELSDYEKYVEAWAHEAKTPLSLLTLILDNHDSEMSPTFKTKLEYVRSQLQEDISQILYYARLKSSTKDYYMEEIVLWDCIDEVLEDYSPLLEEKGFTIHNELVISSTYTVFTDRRGLQFILGQIISNSIKYCNDSPILTISFGCSDSENIISIEDNGSGIKDYDLPYIFQKGFTGDSTASRKKATGMGLYLSKKMADDLNLKLEASSKWGEGFKMEIIFPK